MATAESKSKFEPYWYIMESEAEDETPTRWQIKPLKPQQKERLMTMQSKQLGFFPSSYEQTLTMGLKDWEGFNDADGNPVRHSRANMEYISEPDRVRLALEIYYATSLEEDEIKNSQSQSKSA